MFNSRRGTSVIVGAILLTAVAISSAAVLWSAFSLQGLPQSDVNQVLEDVRIVKVTPDNGRIYVYVINRGSTVAVVDSLYFESIYGSLNWTAPIPPVAILPGETKVIDSTPGVDITEPVVVKVITTEGAVSSLLVMNDSGAVTEPTPGITVTTYALMPYRAEYNGTVYDLSLDDSLQEVDINSIQISAQETLYNVTNGVSPIIDECENVKNVTKAPNNDFHWQIENDVRSIGQDLYLRVVYGGSVGVEYAERLILKMKVQVVPPNRPPNSIEIKFFNWTSGQYITSGYNGYLFVDMSRPNWKDIVMIVPQPSPDIIKDGEYKFAIDIVHPGDNDNSTVVFKSLNVAVVTTTVTQTLDSKFEYMLSPDIDPEKITSMEFSMVYSFNYTPVQYNFEIFNYRASSWIKIGTITYDSPSYQYETVSVPVPAGDFSDYVDGSVVRIRISSQMAGVPPFQISIDELRLQVQTTDGS